MWDYANELQVKPEELRNESLLSKDKSGKTICLKATKSGTVKLLEKLWDWANELQLNPEELRTEVVLSRDKYGNTAWHNAASRGYFELLGRM
jgi:ankyrin repeat protein